MSQKQKATPKEKCGGWNGDGTMTTTTLDLQNAKQQRKRRKRGQQQGRSKSPPPPQAHLLICCCQWMMAKRRDKMAAATGPPSPPVIYTARRDLSIADLAAQHQLAVFGCSAASSSQQRPLSTIKNGSVKGKSSMRGAKNGHVAIAIPPSSLSPFADNDDDGDDGMPNNTADYLDCGLMGEEKGGGTGKAKEEKWGMETARTSRVEDLTEYPPMEKLVEQILLAAETDGQMAEMTSEEGKKKEADREGPGEEEEGNAKHSGGGREREEEEEEEERRPKYKQQEQQRRQKAMLPPRLAKFQSPRGHLPSPLSAGSTMSASAPSTIPPLFVVSSSSFPSSSSSPVRLDNDDGDIECQFTVPAGSHHALTIDRPPAWRLALSSLPQCAVELCWVAYFWMASSVALLFQWLLR